jgi:N-methylhydantoinase A
MAVVLRPPWRIGVDVGGTFTDLVVVDATGAIHITKGPTTPADPTEGVLAVVALAARQLDLPVTALLRDCALFIHGSTIATNTVLEGKGAKVGLIATQGFRDTLEIRRGLRADSWDHRPPWPDVIVPRKRRLAVDERVDRQGMVTRPLDPQSLSQAIRTLKGEGVEAVVICLLNSFLNDSHERACHEAIAREWPDVWISRSSQVAPIMGEYERVSTTAIDACVAPRVVPYLRALDERLRSLGLLRRLALVQSNGGIVSVDQVAARPVTLVLSGPAAGVGAIRSLSRAAGSNDLICIEIGGTSCDVTMMQAGEVAMTDQLDVAGYHVNIPSVEIHTIGTGGGTIAGVDRGGMLWVGPHGAGARPGPACYGLGGEEPTVTDAQLILGRLKSGSYAGGLIQLDERRAAEAIEQRVARPLGVDNTTAAAGMIRLMEQKVRHAVERVSIERGYDPARFTLVAGGGAGAMHAAAVARALGCRGVYVPRLAGVFCAFGMCNSDVRHDYVQSWLGDLDTTDSQRFAAAFATLDAKGRTMLEADGFGPDQMALHRLLDLKYTGQQWTIPVTITLPFDPRAIRAAFEESYSRLYGHHQPDGNIEIINLRLAASGLLPSAELMAEVAAGGEPAPSEIRDVYVDERHGRQPVRVYAGADLRVGQSVPGPAIVEEATTTVVVGAGDVLSVDPYRNYAIALAEALP